MTCISSEGRCTAFGSVGFTKGVHHWEVKKEHSEQPGSIFIGVAEKSPASSSGVSYRLNRWLGWGFVNFRATYSAGSKRVYEVHCLAGDIIGVLLDCDAGRLSYFIDGIKYGEHIINDLGCAADFICECYAEYGRWQEDTRVGGIELILMEVLNQVLVSTETKFTSHQQHNRDSKEVQLVTVQHHWTHWTFLETLIIVGQVSMHLFPFIILDQS